MSANLSEVQANGLFKSHYILPRRYTNLTSIDMDLWDACYYLAITAQLELAAALESAASEMERQRVLTRAADLPPGKFDTSTRELTDLTGIDRRDISKFVSEMEDLGLVVRDSVLEGGHRYALHIKDFQFKQKGILKPHSYVQNGWLKAIRGKNNLALPKRLLNYYLGLPANTAATHGFNSMELGSILRKQDLNGKLGFASKEGFHPIPPGELAQAHYMLRDLGLIIETGEKPGYYRLDRARLYRFPPDAPADPLAEWQASSLYLVYRQENPLRFKWLEELLREGYYPQDEPYLNAIWDGLTSLQGDQARFEILKKKARGQRDNVQADKKWSETWRVFDSEVKKRSFTLETTPAFSFPLQVGKAEHRVELDERLAEFFGDVFEPQLRGRISAPQVYQPQLRGREIDLHVESQQGSLYVGPLAFNKAKGLRQLGTAFRQPETYFPLTIRLAGGWNLPGCHVELWFQGNKLKTG